MSASRRAASRGEPRLVCCSAGRGFARALTRSLARVGGGFGPAAGEGARPEEVDFRFPDGEAGARLGRGVGGCDVFVVQCLCNPVAGTALDENYLALLLAARACREGGATHVTAVVPYLAYARQDKPTPGAIEPTAARLLADLAVTAGIDALVTWHPHSAQVRGFYAPLPFVAPDPRAHFVRELRRFRGRRDAVVVAPDEGASRLAAGIGRALGLRCAIATKHRPARGRAAITEVLGDFRGVRTALVVDDMISSGGTVHGLVTTLARATRVEEIRLAASHNLCRPAALDALRELHDRHRLAGVTVTDSVPQTPEFLALPFLAVRPLAGSVARLVAGVRAGLAPEGPA